MSTDGGGKDLLDGAVRAAKDAIAERPRESEQFDFLDVPTPEQMADAQHALGDDARPREVLAEARRRGGGRKPGSRNRRSEDFERWVLQFGRHPARALIEIASASPEVLIERSAAMDPSKRRMTYAEALAIIMRASDILMPYLVGKKPVEIKHALDGDFALLIPGLNITEGDARAAAEGTFVLEADYVELDPEGGAHE